MSHSFSRHSHRLDRNNYEQSHFIESNISAISMRSISQMEVIQTSLIRPDFDTHEMASMAHFFIDRLLDNAKYIIYQFRCSKRIVMFVL